jgi:hypothetical protein
MDVPKTRKLIEMTTESVSSVVKSLVSSADEAAAFDTIMSLIKCRRSKIIINGMILKLVKRIDWSDGVLPDIANNVI